MEDAQQLRSPSFFSPDLLLFPSFCLHGSLKRNINFVCEISGVKYNAFTKFSAQNIFVSKCNDENFWRELFGIENSVNENNANENKANYGMYIL